MGQVHRPVALLVLLLCCGGDEPAPSAESTCKPFPRPATLALRTTPLANETPRTLFGDRRLEAEGVTFVIAWTDSDFAVVREASGDMVDLARIPKALGNEAPIPMALDGQGRLLVAAVDVVLSLDATKPSTPRTIAEGFAGPRAVFSDPVTRDIWLIDREGGADVAHRIRETFPPAKVSRLDAPGFFLPLRADGAAVVVRDGRSPNLEGHLLYTSGGTLVVVEPFGPAGPPIATTHVGVGGVLTGITTAGSAVVEANGASAIVEDASAVSAPRTLSATGCLEPYGAIPYQVSSPLWSDGAEKVRSVVLPPGTEGRALVDGDLKFPVGTIAIKSFWLHGKRIETRLFVQHALDDWVGYSYAWNAAGTDADLVVGNAVKDDWYFPSSSDCNACHTAAAGFTLGLEARQLGPTAHASLVKSPSNTPFSPTDARAYLHSNCSICHREGNATGAAVLDLRFDTHLAETGLCNESKIGTPARIVAPGAPEDSVLVKRMRALDETRMPKLATSKVDEAGVAVVESWIRSLASCP